MGKNIIVAGKPFYNATAIKVPTVDGNEAEFYEQSFQAKTVTPSESKQDIYPDSGYAGLSKVEVNAISSNYVGSNIPRQNSNSLTVAGGTITGPSGYYEAVINKAEPTGSITLPSSVSAANASVTVSSNRITLNGNATISAAVSAGYIAAGVSSAVNIQQSANITTKGAELFTPGTVDKTIAAGQYLRGVQTIAGDSNLLSRNIALGVSIFGVEGSHEGGITPAGETTITSNGVHDVYDFATARVNVSTVNNTSLSVVPSESEQTFTPTDSYTGFSPVTVAAISSNYVGSNIARIAALTASGPTVTAPSGYYADTLTKTVTTATLPTTAVTTSTGTTKATVGRSTSDQYINIPVGYNTAAANYKISAVANGSVSTPATTITANPTPSLDTTTGKITVSVSGSSSITPSVTSGYISSGNAGTVTVSGSSTMQLSTQSAITITPTESVQTAVASGKYTLGEVNVAAISSKYVGSGVTRPNALKVVGDTVTAESGYYATSKSGKVAAGGVSTPSVTKTTELTPESVCINITPYVNTSAGYIANSSRIDGETVTVSAQDVTAGIMEITTNGTYTVTNYQKAKVNISTVNNQSLTVTPSESAQTFTPDTGYTGFNPVTVNSMPSGSVTMSDISITPSLSAAVAATPPGRLSISVSGESTISASVSAGYIASGTSANISVSSQSLLPLVSLDSNFKAENIKSGVTMFKVTGSYEGAAISLQKKTVTPNKTIQMVWPDSQFDGLSEVQVNAIPSNYVIPSGTLPITGNGIVDVTAYASVSVAVPASGIDPSDATATAAEIFQGKTAYIAGGKVTGTYQKPNITKVGNTLNILNS